MEKELLKEECIFCKIIKGDIPSKKVYENEYVYGFLDINPVAEKHVLLIPKKHIQDLMDLNIQEDQNYIINITKAAKEIAEEFGIDKTGFRLVTNNGKHAGQEVFHIHYHLLGGEKLGNIG